MKIAVFLALLVLSSIVFASGNLTINGTSMAPTYGNANTQIKMLNLSLNVTGDYVNISSINFTIISGTGNVSSIEIFNSSMSSIASSSSFNTTTNKTNVAFSNGLFVNSTSNATIIIALNLSSSASSLSQIALNLSSASDAALNDNVSISGNSIQSGNTQMQNIQANASISPRYVDTSVENQTLIYTITPTGADQIKNFTLNVPIGYTIVSLVSIIRSGSVLVPSTDYTNVTASNSINISLVSPTNLELKINFTVNTNVSAVNPLTFNSTITGGNFTNVNTTMVNNTVKTSQLIALNSISITKGAAIVNGTDYWEFTFSVNATENISTGGFIQFKMSDWNNSVGQTMQVLNYSSLRLNSNNTFNVTNNYNISNGISFSSITSSNPISLILKMIIPASAPISSSWFTTYNMLFRSFS